MTTPADDGSTAFMRETARILAEAIARAVPAPDATTAASRIMSAPLSSTNLLAQVMAGQILELTAQRLRAGPQPQPH